MKDLGKVIIMDEENIELAKPDKDLLEITKMIINQNDMILRHVLMYPAVIVKKEKK